MRRAAAGVLLTAALLPAAHAARPLVTDDARIVDAKACQMESWVRRNEGSTEFWALPGCNPFGNLEMTFGGARTREDGQGSRFSDEVIQLKTLFKPLGDSGWGVGLASGAIRHPTAESSNGFGNSYVYVPFSVYVPDTPAIVHVNVGGARQSDRNRNVTTWGVGTEVQLAERAYFVGEFYGENTDKPFFQAGVRFWVIRDRVQVDTTYGNRVSGGREDHWFSIGMRLLSPPFLP